MAPGERFSGLFNVAASCFKSPRVQLSPSTIVVDDTQLGKAIQTWSWKSSPGSSRVDRPVVRDLLSNDCTSASSL